MKGRFTQFLNISAILAALLVFGCGQQTDDQVADTQNYQLQIENHRAGIQAEFKGKDSPLPDSLRADFTGVQYYPIDSSFRVDATFTPRSNGPIFTIQATGEIADMYQTVGDLQFTLQGIQCRLEVYKNLTLEQESGMQYYFIPFFDKTNGSETYGGGRYMDLEQIRTGHMQLDFNLAYQPYCYYNHGYSCPIPPLANTLPVAVMAGEKM